MRGRFSATIARSAKVLFLVAVVSGVTFSIHHAETQQPSVATPQSMDEVLPRVAEPSSVKASAVSTTPESPASQTAWHAVGEWRGNGNTDTERFTIGAVSGGSPGERSDYLAGSVPWACMCMTVRGRS